MKLLFFVKIYMTQQSKKSKLSSLTSKQGLIVGSVMGVMASLIGSYFLVPIFEKSESNAIEIVKVNENLVKTEDNLADTTNELKETQDDLNTSTKKVEALATVESDLKTAKSQISELEEASQKDGESIGTLQDQVEDQDASIESLTAKTKKLYRVIDEKKLAIKLRSQWIEDLKQHDDIVIKNATSLVENFMKISDDNDNDNSNSITRERLLIKTLTLVNSLESRLNKRRIYLKELSEKLKQK
jgi:methyl-accepting chemotaxis protein